jgi:excisionase family DNA binding protein
MSKPRLLTVNEAAELLGIHKQTLHRWCVDGKIAFIQPAPRSPRRFRRADVMAKLEPRTKVPA